METVYYEGMITDESAANLARNKTLFTSIEADPSNLENQSRLAATERFIQMTPVQDGYFEVQSDDDGTALLETDVGRNFNYIVAAGSTVTGFSGVELNSDSAGTTTSLDLQLVALVDREDNLLSGTGSTNKNAIVRFSDSQYKPGRLGV